MPSDPRVLELVEEILDSGRSPEDVCRDCPELLPQVREFWQRHRAVQAQLSALFPETDPAPEDSVPPLVQVPEDLGPLPHIPGYAVQAVLGHGGMGVVYKAWHLRLQRPVALKMVLAGAFARPAERERLLREAAAVAGLQHANIVQVHDVGDHDGRPYFTMEFIEGGSLAQQLTGTPQPADQAAALVATLAEAVQVAHQGGIVHRDLKPANILLTADGTPKVSDFGLARRLEDDSGLTQSGAPLGTPSYMAPEQAQGQRDAVGPAADVYALGAILYELLTGRPPFRAETAAATLQQVLTAEPVPPARLNPRVPRDLDTICLKCLQKEPRRRYASAAALAEDLRRFERGEPITARPLGRLGRLARWARRRPTTAALTGTLLAVALLTLALVGSWLWVNGQRTANLQAVEEDLREVTRLLQTSDPAGARAALERARGRLGADGTVELQARVDQANRHLELVAKLEAIRLKRAVVRAGRFNRAQADRDYAAAFATAGLGTDDDDPEALAARVAASPVRAALVAALDDWAVCADQKRREWLLAVARQADPDPWRNRVRDPRTWADRKQLTELARTAPVKEQSLQILVAVGERLQADHGDATAFLRRVQKEHPTDFYANFMLANALANQGADGDAIGFYRAALAVRPNTVVARYNLGLALHHLGQLDEAIDHFERALDIDPTFGWTHAALALALEANWRLDEAIDHYRAALRLNPFRAAVHYNLGRALIVRKRFDEAIHHLRQAATLEPRVIRHHLVLAELLNDRGRLDDAGGHFRQAIALDPKRTDAQKGLRGILIRQGKLEAARAAWRKALDAGPPEHDAWFGYAELCLFLGQEDEYRRARRVLLDRFGASTDPQVAERTGRACLLLPATNDELEDAAALVERALAAGRSGREWAYPYFLFARGLAEYRRGRFDSAIAVMEGEASGVMGPAPRLIVAMAQHRLGKGEEARKTLAAAIGDYDWRADRRRTMTAGSSTYSGARLRP